MRTVGAATELLPGEAARTPAWYEARRHGITASEIATVLGLSRWDSPLSLYFRKRGELDDDEDDYRMALGRELEHYVLRCFTTLTGIDTDPCGLVASTERPWQLATPDSVCAGHLPVEAKTALSEDNWGPSGTSQVPIAYRAQLLWQCDTLGADRGYLCVIFLRSGEPRWYEIDWDSADVGVMREAGAEFLRRVTDGDPPAADSLEATRKALKARYPASPDVPDVVCGASLERSWRAALKADKAAAERKAELENRIRVLMGQSTRLRGPDGDIIATRRVYQRAGYEVKPAMIDALYPSKGMKE